jgi:diaminopimelate decarboxylase
MATKYDAHSSLTLGGASLSELFERAAPGEKGASTPAYVYDLDAIAAEARELRSAFDDAPHVIAYAVKANTAGPVVRALAAEGCGADVVSAAELEVALACGIDADRIVFSGVAKRDDEIDRAIAVGTRGIAAIQIESLEELQRIAARVRSQGGARRARVSLRINPAVEESALATHRHIATGHDEAKFGIPWGDVGAAIDRVVASAELDLVGLGAHVGSQLTSTAAYVEAARHVFDVAVAVRARVKLRFVDTGGGFGIDYGDGCATRPADFVRAVRSEQRAMGLSDLELFIEPGRSLVAAHGILVARVIQAKVAKERRWLMIDAGMNDLLRPALYQARHRIVPFTAPPAKTVEWQVVGPVCESSDDFGLHMLPEDPPPFVAILDAGAYGFTMASQYNGRSLPAELFLRAGRIAHTSPASRADAWIASRVSID